jgi:DNA-directed RNA polymerase specialized sigma subunit
MFEAEKLSEAIRRLPPQDAEIIWDVYYHQMTLNDVARKRNLAPQHVQAIHARALKLLRGRMKGRA